MRFFLIAIVAVVVSATAAVAQSDGGTQQPRVTEPAKVTKGAGGGSGSGSGLGNTTQQPPSR